ALTMASRSARPRPAMPMQATRMSEYFVFVVDDSGLGWRFGRPLPPAELAVVGVSVDPFFAGASAAFAIPAAALAAARRRRNPRRVMSDLLIVVPVPVR